MHGQQNIKNSLLGLFLSTLAWNSIFITYAL